MSASGNGLGARAARAASGEELAARLKRMLNPRKVAWFGGGGIAPALRYMQANGFGGEVVVVHPSRADVGGVACVRSPADLPFVPDLAVLFIPKEGIHAAVGELSAMGCGGAVCISSGFLESRGGAQRQGELVAAAGEMPVVGPNCPGFGNFLDGAVFMMDHFGAHRRRESGVAVISNGGAYLSDLGCAERSQPIAYMLGLGNQAMVTAADMLDVVLDDARVSAVNVYFESMHDVAKLSRAAAKAAERGVPVVAVKGGRSQAGARAARMHTAALCGEAEIASALFRRFGWIEARTPSEALETIKMLTYTPIPQGMRAGFVTSSGSYAVLGGDVAEALGLEMSPPDASVRDALEAALPEYVSASNPLDIADAHGWSPEKQAPIYEAFVGGAYDVFAQVMCYPPEGGWDMRIWDETTELLARARGEKPAAFVNTLAEALPVAARERMIGEGVAPLQGMEDGLRAVAHAARYGARRESLVPEKMVLSYAPGERGGSEVVVNEAEAKRRLAAAGIDIPRQWVVSEEGEGLPDAPGRYALKAMVSGLLHKTEAGAVALGLEAEALPAALSSMQKTLAEGGLIADGFLIEEMVEGAVAELLVGVRRVEGVGWAVTPAFGGAAVELVGDAATVILPASRAELEAALRGLKLAPLLLGYRGRAAADLSVVLDAIESLCAFAVSEKDVVALEVNPLLATRSRAVVVDAVLTQIGKEKP